MALIVEKVTRTFVYENQHNGSITLSDIPGLTPEQVLEHYAGHYPELTTGVVNGPFPKGNGIEYKFITKLVLFQFNN